MARSFFGAVPYITAPAGVVAGISCGQWVRVPGYQKKGRFVRYTTDGQAYIIYPSRRDNAGVVTNVAFRQACGKPIEKVVPRVQVQGNHTVMDKDKVVALEAAGFRIGDTADFLKIGG